MRYVGFSWARAARRAAAIAILVVLVTVLVAPAVLGASTTNVWTARLGSGGANGTATLTAYTNGGGTLALKLAKLPPAVTLAVVVARGTCNAVGKTVVSLPAIKTSRAGAASRTSSLKASQVAAVYAATANGGKMVVRVGTGATAKCGPFAAQVTAPYVDATITVGYSPQNVAIDTSGVWVTNYADNSLSRIDRATNTVLQTVPIALTGRAGPAAIAAGMGSLWVTTVDFDSSRNFLPGAVLRIDPASGNVLATIPAGKSAQDIAVGAGAVWVVNTPDNTVLRIDPATNQVAATITITLPSGVAADATSAWVVSDDGLVSRIDPATNQVAAAVHTQDTGGRIGVGSGAIWVTNYGHTGQADGSVTRIDPATNQVVAKTTVGEDPWDIAIGGGSVWVGLYDAPTVVQLDAATNAVLRQVTVAGNVYRLAADDQSVWALWNPGRESTGPGSVTRITHGKGTLAKPAPIITPVPTASPAPTATPAPSASPGPTAPSGAALYIGTYFSLTLPSGWTFSAPTTSGDTERITFLGTGNQEIGVVSNPTALSLDDMTAVAVAASKSAFGVDPEQTESITLGGAPARLLTFHVASGTATGFVLEAVCVHNGRGYMLVFMNDAGTEAADRALFTGILATFTFTSRG